MFGQRRSGLLISLGCLTIILLVLAACSGTATPAPAAPAAEKAAPAEEAAPTTKKRVRKRNTGTSS